MGEHMLNPIYWIARLAIYKRAYDKHNPKAPAPYKQPYAGSKTEDALLSAWNNLPTFEERTETEVKALTAIKWTLIVAGVLVVCALAAGAYDTYRVYQDYARQGYSQR
jgi:hypothetical protein